MSVPTADVLEITELETIVIFLETDGNPQFIEVAVSVTSPAKPVVQVTCPV